MKKILVAVDHREININVLDFACYIAKLTHSKLAGVFVDKKELQEQPMKTPVYSATAASSTTGTPITEVMDQNIRLFKEACTNRGANCIIHKDMAISVDDIIQESRFAELLIVDPAMSFGEKREEIPSHYIKEVLAKSECPVLLAPFSFYGIDEVVFAYDGKSESVYAIKQFIYLFPELTGKKVTVLQVNEDGGNVFIGKEKIGELLQLHYSSIGFQLLSGKASDKLFGYLLGKKNVFVVMGAFGRSMLSGIFKHSTAELVIKTINLPVFIAHHK